MAELATHNFPLDSVLVGWEKQDLYRNDPDGMPPLATYIPDTAALKVLGEWVVGLGSMTGIRAEKSRASPIPYIRNRVLIAPPGWTGKIQMLDVRGQVFALEPLGEGRYAMPEAAKAGVYFFRAGRRYFKASILR